MYNRTRRERRDSNTVHFVQDRADDANVLLQRCHDRWRVRQDANALRRRDGKHGRHGRREHEGRAVDALVLRHNGRARAESTSSAE